MREGLPVELYVLRRHPKGASNGGVSETIDDFIIMADDEYGIPALFERPDSHVLLLQVFKGQFRVVPLKNKEAGDWVMFGGNFVFSPDSRFPSPHPIKVFDRVER